MMDYSWFDFLGNLGVIIILGCYLSLQMGKMHSRDLLFSSLNAIGAGLILLSLYVEFNLSAFLMELFWLLISFFGIMTELTRKYREHISQQQ